MLNAASPFSGGDKKGSFPLRNPKAEMRKGEKEKKINLSTCSKLTFSPRADDQQSHVASDTLGLAWVSPE